MKVWCFPYTSSKPHHNRDYNLSDLGHIRQFLPCGSLLLKSLNPVTHSYWNIKVNKAFGVNVTIVEFDLDTSVSCEHVNLALHFLESNNKWCTNDDLKFCGSRPPWSTILPFSVIKVLLLQLYVIKVPLIYLLYEPFDLALYQEIVMLIPSYITIHGSVQARFQGQSYYWLLKTFIRARLRIQIMRCEWFRSNITLYDGPTKDIKLTTIENCYSDNGYDILSTIHWALLAHSWATYNISFAEEDFIHLRFSFEAIEFKYLRLLENRTAIRKSIVHPTSKMAITGNPYRLTSKQDTFIKIQLHVNALNGYTKPYCTHGGIMMITNFFYTEDGRRKADDYGPYCDIQPGRSLLGSNNEMILPGNVTDIYFYAFSTYFQLDVTLTITITPCVGLINICRFCSIRSDYIYETDKVVLKCIGTNRISLYQVPLTCIRIQSMLTAIDVHCEFNFEHAPTEGKVLVDIIYFAPNKVTSFVQLNSRSCKQSFSILSKYTDKQTQLKRFSQEDAQLSIVPRFTVIQHLYECKYAEFSYSVNIDKKYNHTVCATYRNVTDFIDKSICGELILASERSIPLYRFTLRSVKTFLRITPRVFHRLMLHYPSGFGTVDSYDQLYILQDASAIANIDSEKFPISHISCHRYQFFDIHIFSTPEC